jgi:AraC-like DNA-binding protein
MLAATGTEPVLQVPESQDGVIITAMHTLSVNDLCGPNIPLTVLIGQHGDNPIGLHAHDFIELVFFAEGSSIHEYAGRRYKLEPGDIFVIHPGEPHAYVHSRRAKVYNCLFLAKVLQADLEYLKKTDGFFELIMVEPFFRCETGLRDVLHLDAATRLRVSGLLAEMHRELEQQRPGYEALARAMLIQLLVTVARFYSQNQKERNLPGDDLFGKRALIRQCIHYIEEHYPEEIRLENLADQAYLSPEYFSKVFKQLTAQTPIEFVNTQRLDKAKHLLTTSTLPITDIAFRTGFHDLNYFSRRFKKNTGLTPGKYRKKHWAAT